MLFKSIFHLGRSAGGGGTETLAVGPGEGGITPKTGPETAFRGGEALVDQFPGVDQPPVAKIIVDGLAHFLAEKPHHVEFTDVELLRNGVDGQIFRQMGVNIPQNVQNPAVFAGLGLGKFRLGIFQVPAHFRQNLQQQTGTEDLSGIAAAGQFLFQTGAKGVKMPLPMLTAGPSISTETC